MSRPATKSTKSRSNIAQVCDDIAVYLGLSESNGVNRVPLSQYDGALVAMNSTMARIGADPWCKAHKKGFNFATLNQSFETCIAMAGTKVDKSYMELLAASPVDAMKRCKLYSRGVLGSSVAKTVALYRSLVFHDGTYRSSTGYMQVSDKTGWYMPAGGVHGTPFGESLAFNFDILATVSIFKPKMWLATMRYNGYPGLSLETDPTGIKELFKDRDKPDHGGRRAAIKHWVSEHWRKSRIDEGDEIHVREHLRGVDNFMWNGMNVTIQLPIEDHMRAGRAISAKS